MHVTLDIPDQKSTLDGAIAKQFADIQRQLMGLVKESASSKSQLHSVMMSGMAEQQDSFLKAMERLMGMVQQAVKSSHTSDGMVDALRGLKATVADLPGDLKSALNQQYQAFQEKSVKVSVKPQITVSMPQGLTTRLDALETALLGGKRGFHTRTFGSNY